LQGGREEGSKGGGGKGEGERKECIFNILKRFLKQ